MGQAEIEQAKNDVLTAANSVVAEIGTLNTEAAQEIEQLQDDNRGLVLSIWKLYAEKLVLQFKLAAKQQELNRLSEECQSNETSAIDPFADDESRRGYADYEILESADGDNV